MTQPTACIIITGNEILSGRTQDLNLPWLAQQLEPMGIKVAEARVIPDDETMIVNTVNTCRKNYTYLFITGGIGPTHDDITAQCVAKAFNVPLEQNSEAVQHLKTYYTTTPLNDARLRMARIPRGAILIRNPVSGAPGFQIENVYVMAGIPNIMHGMFDDVRPRLQGGLPILTVLVSCHIAEGNLAAGLLAIQDQFPQLSIGSYPSYEDKKPFVRLALRGTNPNTLDQATQAVADMIRNLGGEPVVEKK